MTGKAAIDWVKHRAGEDWLPGYSSQELADLAQVRLKELTNWQTRPRILLAERQPIRFLAGFTAACSTDCDIFLANPDWGDIEWQQVFELVQPDVVWGEKGKFRSQESGVRSQELEDLSPSSSALAPRVPPSPPLPLSPSSPASPAAPSIQIPTGGSSGRIRFVMHTWATLMASVQGFRQYFDVDRVNSLCVLPLYHVSGLMQFLRSLISGGTLVILPFKTLTTGTLPPPPPEPFFLSLVPTQLHRLLPASPPLPPSPLPWLSRFHAILLGGAPAWAELLETARNLHIPLAPTYGMTETASQIATLKPGDFLRGLTGCGQVLPHATVTIRGPNGDRLAPGQVGAIAIQANSLALGYYPTPFDQMEFQTDDLGFLDTQGYLHIVGRQGDKIITGGENVFPAEVEAAIRATGLVLDVCVVGLGDRHWGQAITAVYVPVNSEIAVADLKTYLENRLTRFKRPKHWVATEQLPRNDQGKVNRLKVEKEVQFKIQNSKFKIDGSSHF